MSSNAFLTADKLEVRQPGAATHAGPVVGGAVDAEQMTIGGVASATSVLLVLVLGSGIVGWNLVDVSEFGGIRFPSWLIAALLGGVAMLVVAYLRPHLARFIAPAYALIEGLVVGAISHLYEFEFQGIVLQAVLLTVSIFAAMLFLYGTRIIRVTDRLRRGVVAATLGIMAVYLFQLVMNLVGVGFEVPYLHDSGPIGIGVSLLIIGVAAFNYLIDFDFIERAAASGAPKDNEWLAALGLLVTTVWLYLELLRLLAKVRD